VEALQKYYNLPLEKEAKSIDANEVSEYSEKSKCSSLTEKMLLC
jgi:hypothetical protein